MQIGTDHPVNHPSAPIVRTARLFLSDRIQAFETKIELDHNTPDKQEGQIHQLESLQPLASANADTDGSSHVHMELHNRGSVRDCKWKPAATFLKRVGLCSNETDFSRRDPGTVANKVLAGSTNHRSLAMTMKQEAPVGSAVNDSGLLLCAHKVSGKNCRPQA